MTATTERDVERLLRRAIPLLVPLPFLAACLSGESAPSGVEVRDSAGVEIVTVTRPADAYGPVGTVADEPDLQLGSVEAEGPELFGSVGAVRTLPDGTLLVADGGAVEIRVFDGGGTYLRTIGGKGEGPGEFQAIGSIPRVGSDSIQVWDSRQRRLSVFDTAGRLLDATAPQDPPLARTLSILPDGTLLTEDPWSGAPMSSTNGVVLSRDSVVLIRRDSAGEPLDTVAVVPSDEALRRVEASGSGLIRLQEMSAPVARSLFYTPHPGGLVGGPNDTFQLSWWTVDGILGRITRMPSLDRPLTSGDVNALRKEWIADSNGSPASLRMIETIFDYPLPELRPAFEEVLPGPGGTVWVREHSLWEHARPRWWVFDAETGAPAGYVELPAGLEVQEIGPDYVLGVYRDDLGVAYVRRHRMELETP